MTKSPRSIYVVVRLDFHGNDVSNDSIQEAVDNMNYSFDYDDDYLRIVNTEIVDTFYNYQG